MWRIFDYSLGGYYLRGYWIQLFTGVVDAYSMTRCYWKYLKLKYDGLHYILSLYSKKVFFDYSLGGYSHREQWARTRRYFLVKHYSLRSAGLLLPSGASFMVMETWIFSVKIWLRHEILKLCYHNVTRMPWLVTKVRPRDPSCEAWYTHMDALCWYVSVSMTQRKSWWTHWVPWESLGFILCKS
jgi:hypothetical protein